MSSLVHQLLKYKDTSGSKNVRLCIASLNLAFKEIDIVNTFQMVLGCSEKLNPSLFHILLTLIIRLV